MARIMFSPLAREDLQEIKRYIRDDLDSPQAAKRITDGILKRIRMLDLSPEIGTPLSAICNIVSDYRFLVSEKYLVFYRYEESSETAFIVRVLHGSRNYITILFGVQTEESLSLFDKE
jgi:addiction module RelE/StbE family toxin